jgi:hypothetical protein
MLSAIRSRLTYANVAVTVALVFAMTGGAYAAKKYLITSTKQISPSVLKALQGKGGVAGAAGVAGAQGPAGPAGPAGPGGGKGDTGAAGKEGAQGKEGPQGKQGATGTAGTKGANGSPWTADGTLPGKATETGAWAFGPAPKAFFAIPVAISFNVPLAGPLTNVEECNEPSKPACRVHYLNAAGKELRENVSTHELVEETSAACHGSAAVPTADPGNLCVYTSELAEALILDGRIDQAGPGEVAGASTAGAVIRAFPLSENGNGWGTWAVTGEE